MLFFMETGNKQTSPDQVMFWDRTLPTTEGWLAGYAALIVTYKLKVPLPENLAYISHQHKTYNELKWRVYSLRYKPEDTLGGQLEFAFKYEGIDLAILNALFEKIQPHELEQWVNNEPNGRYSRRAWFFYEWLTGKILGIEDIKTAVFVDAVDPKLQFTGPALPSKRHRVRNNLPGTRDFCPLVRRTNKLEMFQELNLAMLAHEKAGAIHPDVLSRAAAFLLLKDSRASFAIEGEHPKKGRAERWGKAIAQAGINPLSIQELLRLQKIIIEDSRFIPLGLRTEGGFIGVHERMSRIPLPDHISARWQDLSRLMEGLISTYKGLNKKGQIDPVILAAAIAFGFVFIHPFADGNGRMHRYLIHHVLAELEFTPRGIVFPVSAVILERLNEYRLVLESYSRPRLEFIDWRPTESGNVEILNETLDLYRYFDATKMAEFLYDCVRETIEQVLPEEISYLENYDKMKRAINELIDMPDNLLDLLIHFLQQNNGTFSKRAREKEFHMLTEQERSTIEGLYSEIFGAESKA
jgi:hypothetical protein